MFVFANVILVNNVVVVVVVVNDGGCSKYLCYLLWSLLPCSLTENEGSKRRKIEEGDLSL